MICFVYVSCVLSGEQKTIKGQGEVCSHPLNHQGNLYGLKTIKGKLITHVGTGRRLSNCPTRHQGNSQNLLNRQGIACDAAVHAMHTEKACMQIV